MTSNNSGTASAGSTSNPAASNPATSNTAANIAPIDLEKGNAAQEQTIEEIVASLGETVGQARVDNPKMSATGVNVFYADKQAIFDVDLDIANNEVISMIGPSGCGKSTLLRCLNRMNDTICLLYTSPSPRDLSTSRMPSSA